jgi:hypothetical protein
MSQPKRDRSPGARRESDEGSPTQPRPRAAPLGSIEWSEEKLATILGDDDDTNDKRNKHEFLSPTILSSLRVGPRREFNLPITIDTVLEAVDVWWPTPAANLWHGLRDGEGGRADGIRAQVRVDSIVGGMNWSFSDHEVHVEGAQNEVWPAERVSAWTAIFLAKRRGTNT